MITFGQVVRSYRQSMGLSLKDLARKVGTQKGYVCMIELGSVSPPSAKVTAKIASVLGIPGKSLLILGWVQKAPKLIRKILADKLDLERIFA